jgi:hypothetical protein
VRELAMLLKERREVRIGAYLLHRPVESKAQSCLSPFQSARCRRARYGHWLRGQRRRQGANNGPT